MVSKIAAPLPGRTPITASWTVGQNLFQSSAPSLAKICGSADEGDTLCGEFFGHGVDLGWHKQPHRHAGPLGPRQRPLVGEATVAVDVIEFPGCQRQALAVDVGKPLGPAPKPEFQHILGEVLSNLYVGRTPGGGMLS